MSSFSDEMSDRILVLVVNIIKLENKFVSHIPVATFTVSIFDQGPHQEQITKKQEQEKAVRILYIKCK